VELCFEGIAVPARPGETIAAALTAAGLLALRVTRDGGQRGLFCGMGVCQDCVVEVDGRARVRACMTKVTEPHRIRRQTALPVISTAPLVDADETLPIHAPDIAVLGGGAAGLSAASVAAESGASVLLIDERPVPGGQYFKQPVGLVAAQADRQSRAGAALLERTRRSGAVFLAGATAWGAFTPLELAVAGPDGACVVRPRRLIVATGAYERALPVPGWTLPGVMTTGATQTLLRSYGVAAGQRVLVAGNGPLNMQVALELARAGARVVAVAELAPSPRALRPLWRMVSTDPGLTMRGLGYLAALRLRGISLLHGHCLTRIGRDGAGLRATLARWDGARFGAERQVVVDVVTMGYGFQPANDVLRALGAVQDFDAARNQLVTRRDGDCLTSVPHVYAVGDCCGLGGAQAAQSEGVIAGLAAAASLGHTPAPALLRRGAAARSLLGRQRRFQRGLWQSFSAADPTEAAMTHDTVVCRCENITRAELEAILADGFDAIGAIKRLTRVGMGPCQGRYCALPVAQMIARRTGQRVDEAGLFAPRPPTRPVRIGDLLGCGG
jgi:thioredoxin reductase